MQLFNVMLAVVAGVTASPMIWERQAPVPLCSGVTGTAQCCATDVLGLADLDCANPPKVPNSTAEFTAICSDIGQRARCCALPVLGQALICNAPVGS